MEVFVKHFRREPGGSWTCVSPTEFMGPNGRIQVTPGSCFAPGTKFMGVDLAAWLDEQAGLATNADDR